MQRVVQAFETSFRRHLAVEQRAAVLDVLGGALGPDSTVGQLADAALALGWPEFGELSLADLADALLGAPHERPAGTTTHDDDEDDDDVDDVDDVEADETDDDDDADDDDADDDDAPAVTAKPARGRATKPAAEAASASKPTAAAKPKARGKASKISLDDRMNLDEAAAVLLPLVRELGEATMQQLEQSTAGAGRRKLRFHIGQLVKHGRLERHGMGRGTYYTIA
ncbi:MAG: hypothetical protein IPK74_28615 [Deltaproteobacteria bacterium]|nr:hypothetical protein [Deltaproteobacteria bacterium]